MFFKEKEEWSEGEGVNIPGMVPTSSKGILLIVLSVREGLKNTKGKATND